MSERFIIDNKISLDNDRIDTYELSTLVDTDNKTFYFIVDSLANIQGLCDRLNELNDDAKYWAETAEVRLKEIDRLQSEYELYKFLWEQMSYYFRDDVTLKDLDHKDFRALQRLAQGLVD